MEMSLLGVGPELVLLMALAFFMVYFAVPVWIRKMHALGIVGNDMNKPGKPEVAEMGGIPLMFGFILSVLIYIGIKTFYYSDPTEIVNVLALLATMLLMTLIGVIDDILGWKKGLRQSHKVLLTVPAALPLMVVKAGTSTMFLPLIGSVDLCIIYPLLVVPAAIIIASNGFNMLAGYNGLEASMGVLILGALGAAAWFAGQGVFSVIAFCMVAALLAFLIFNKYPARVFPGDTLTYSVGALAACIAILANLEKMLVILYILYVLDFLLPLRKRMRVEAFARVRKDGGLEAPYKNVYDVTHIALKVLGRVKRKVSENDVVLLVLLLQIIITAFAFGVLWC
jgi:UDP-N-acetylglucosamine--dolichyl-phosphate N-acetylglucosaminephosphotransferase